MAVASEINGSLKTAIVWAKKAQKQGNKKQNKRLEKIEEMLLNSGK